MNGELKQPLTKEKKAQEQSFGNALRSFDVFEMLKHLKRWDMATYKKYKPLPYQKQKRIMCQAIIDNSELLDKELVDKAKKYINNLEVKINVKK